MGNTASLQNRLELTVTVEREDPLRHTPAGMPVLEMWLRHHSRQTIATLERDVTCEIQAVVLGELAKRLAGKMAGNSVHCTGFLNQRSMRNPRLVLHIEFVEFVKG